MSKHPAESNHSARSPKKRVLGSANVNVKQRNGSRTAVSAKIRHVALDKLVPHPDSSNRMSRVKFAKLMHNIELTGRYEPLVIRPCPERSGHYQIINGHHRSEALRRLGFKTVDTVVWDVDDERTDILLTTLNRLQGRDCLKTKLAVLRRLSQRMCTRKMAKLLPQTRGQLERLMKAGRLSQAARGKVPAFAIPIVFFVNEAQQHVLEEALTTLTSESNESTRAGKRTAALMQIIQHFLGQLGGSDPAGEGATQNGSPPHSQAES